MAGPYLELEERLRPLADPLPRPRPGDWLAEHDEPGQTFEEYLDGHPVRKSDKLPRREVQPTAHSRPHPGLPGRLLRRPGEGEAMLTVKRLRELLEGLEEEAPVLVAVVGAEDGHKLLAAAAAQQKDEGLNIRVPSPLQGVEAYQADDGSVVIFAVSQEG